MRRQQNKEQPSVSQGNIYIYETGVLSTFYTKEKLKSPLGLN